MCISIFYFTYCQIVCPFVLIFIFTDFRLQNSSHSENKTSEIKITQEVFNIFVLTVFTDRIGTTKRSARICFLDTTTQTSKLSRTNYPEPNSNVQTITI